MAWDCLSFWGPICGKDPVTGCSLPCGATPTTPGIISCEATPGCILVGTECICGGNPAPQPVLPGASEPMPAPSPTGGYYLPGQPCVWVNPDGSYDYSGCQDPLAPGQVPGAPMVPLVLPAGQAPGGGSEVPTIIVPDWARVADAFGLGNYQAQPMGGYSSQAGAAGKGGASLLPWLLLAVAAVGGIYLYERSKR